MSYWTSSADDFKVVSDPTGGGWNQSKRLVVLSRETINKISEVITKSLEGVHPDGKNIIVPEKTIVDIVNDFFEISPYEGDTAINSAIQHIVTDIKGNYLNDKYLGSLSAWNQKLDGDLKPYSGIKLNEKRFKSEDTWTWTY